jgi:hypothetical protein
MNVEKILDHLENMILIDAYKDLKEKCTVKIEILLVEPVEK